MNAGRLSLTISSGSISMPCVVERARRATRSSCRDRGRSRGDPRSSPSARTRTARPPRPAPAPCRWARASPMRPRLRGIARRVGRAPLGRLQRRRELEHFLVRAAQDVLARPLVDDVAGSRPASPATPRQPDARIGRAAPQASTSATTIEASDVIGTSSIGQEVAPREQRGERASRRPRPRGHPRADRRARGRAARSARRGARARSRAASRRRS